MIERAVGACLVILVGAAALYVAVRLVLAVWLPLVVIGGSLLVVSGLVWAVRARRRGW